MAQELKRRSLAEAALYLAKVVAYPTLNIAHYITQIDTLAEEAEASIGQGLDTAVQAELLSEFLFHHAGFIGNKEAYYDSKNSFLNEVLDGKKGIPITLSILYIAVASRLGLKAYGIGLPGHFIVMVPAQKQRLFFDPFHGGGRLSVADCVRLIQQTTGYDGPFRPDWLDPVDQCDILTRLLNNLRNVYVQQEQWAKGIRTLHCIRHLSPADATVLRDLGVLHYQIGKINRALYYLDLYAQKEPEAADLKYIRQGMAEKLDRWVRLN